MKKLHTLFLALLLVAGLGHTVQAGRRDRSVIVIPVRYTVVQFAFNIARMRPVNLLSYDRGAEDEPLLLYMWDTATTNWKPVEPAAYLDGTLFAAAPKRVFLIDEGGDLPDELAPAPAWTKEIVPISSLKVIDMANTMDRHLKFSAREWKRLAQRHNLELVDDNYEERRYGRYGKPGTKYTGPRPVNPLVARLRDIMRANESDAPPMEKPVPAEEAVEVEEIETEDAATDAASMPTDLPAAEGEAEAAAPEPAVEMDPANK